MPSRQATTFPRNQVQNAHSPHNDHTWHLRARVLCVCVCEREKKSVDFDVPSNVRALHGVCACVLYGANVIQTWKSSMLMELMERLRGAMAEKNSPKKLFSRTEKIECPPNRGDCRLAGDVSGMM